MSFIKKTHVLCLGASFLTSASLHAMDNFATSQAAEEEYRIAYAALDRLNPDDSAFRKGRNNPPLPGTDHSPSALLKIAKKNFKNALEKGHPFAAQGLKHVYTTPEKQEKLKAAFEKSIAFKKANHLTAGLAVDQSSLIDLKKLSQKTMADLPEIEKIYLKKAIYGYSEIADNLTHSDSEAALQALIRLAKTAPDAWFPLAETYFKRKNYAESFSWYAQVIASSNTPYDLFHSLKTKADLPGLPADAHLQLYGLLSDYSEKNDGPSSYSFDIHAKYYEMLGKGHPTRSKIIGRLNRIAEALFEQEPQVLCNLAQIHETTATTQEDYKSIVDMYLRAAHNGVWRAAERMIDAPVLWKTAGIDNVFLALLRYPKNKLGLNKFLKIYRTLDEENDVFPVALSLISPKNEEFQGTFKKLIAESYPPAIDTYCHILTPESVFAAKDLWIARLKDAIAPLPGYTPASSVTIGLRYLPRDLYPYVEQFVEEFSQKDIKRGYDYDYYDIYSGQRQTSSIVVNRDIATQHIKNLEQQQADQKADFAQLKLRKAEKISQLDAQQAYHLAQEYNFLHRVQELRPDFYTDTKPCFQEGYVVCLEQATNKGSVPALQELTEVFSKGYVEKIYHAGLEDFFTSLSYEKTKQIKDLITPEVMGRINTLLKDKQVLEKKH